MVEPLDLENKIQWNARQGSPATANCSTQVLGLQNGPLKTRGLRLSLRPDPEGHAGISQIETMVVPHDKSSLIFDPAGYQKGNEQMTFVPPASEIDSRAEAIKSAMKYPQGLKVGSFVQTDTPFASDA